MHIPNPSIAVSGTEGELVVPFTGSHAAAVLPLARWGLPASALVIGSMSPDLLYYLPGSAEGSHTVAGVLGKDLVLGLAAFVVWQAFVGRAVVALAPPSASRRLVGYPVGLRRCLGTPGRFAGVLLALVIGGLTHLAWDLFTHTHGWMYDHLMWLREDHGPMPGHRWAQWVSEAAGALVISAWVVRWWRQHPVRAGAEAGPELGVATRIAAGAVVVGAAVIGSLRGAGVGVAQGSDRINFMIFYAAVGAGTWGAAALVGVAALWWLTHVARRPA
jgi:hypothetical protein